MDHPIQTDFIRWIVFLPLLGAIVNGVLGAKIQKSLGKGAIALHRLRAGGRRFRFAVICLFYPERRSSRKSAFSSTISIAGLTSARFKSTWLF